MGRRKKERSRRYLKILKHTGPAHIMYLFCASIDDSVKYEYSTVLVYVLVHDNNVKYKIYNIIL